MERAWLQLENVMDANENPPSVIYAQSPYILRMATQPNDSFKQQQGDLGIMLQPADGRWRCIDSECTDAYANKK